jgi:hypothetical protein
MGTMVPPDASPHESAIAAFVRYWRRYRDTGAPHVHPEDKKTGLVRQGGFALNLLPVPIVGNLAQAEAVILVLNPGLDAEDHEWERNGAFRASLLRNLTQTRVCTHIGP